MFNNTSGNNNTSMGYQSLNTNTTGLSNVSIGYQSLFTNTGSCNTSIGTVSLHDNTTGQYNTAIGQTSLYNNTTGSFNIGIGYNAQVPSSTSNFQVRIGDENISYAGIQVAWTITSDRRWKNNIHPSNLGLDFISKLNPVSYTRINDEKQKIEYGFIGQEVDEVLKEFNIDKNGMITVTDDGKYELRYNDLLAPMVKSVQELKEENDGLKNEVNELKNRMNKLEQKSEISNTRSAGFTSGNLNLGFWFLLIFSGVFCATILLKKYTEK